MKLKEIYELSPIKIVTNEIVESIKSVFSNIENGSFDIEFKHEEIESEKRFEERYYMEEGDDKYGGTLASIYFDSKPLAIIRIYGRYNSDMDVFVTDRELYKEAKDYLLSKALDDSLEDTYHSVDEDIEGIEIVGGYDLKDYYDKNLKTQYNLGDIVWAWVDENHLKSKYSEDNKGLVLTRVEISKINHFNPKTTYFGYQLDRKFESGNFQDMVFIKGKGFNGASFNEESILGLVNGMEVPEEAIDNKVDSNGYLIVDTNKKTKKLK